MYDELKKILQVIEENKINRVYIGEDIFANVKSSLNPYAGNFSPPNSSFNDKVLPDDLKYFYTNYHSADIFTGPMTGAGVWIIPLEEMDNLIEEYDIKIESLYPIAYMHKGFVCIDSHRVSHGDKHYIAWVDAMTAEVKYLNCRSFTDWLEKTLISQGQPYWLF